jgi:glycosyltransferase involved in cell wall biosynthesis
MSLGTTSPLTDDTLGTRDSLPRFGTSPFGEHPHHLRRGVTAVLRVKDEARSLPHSLPPLLRAVDAVILVDNRSTDGTTDVARAIAADLGRDDALRVLDYPFAISRCGPEHLMTPPDSVHSLVYFNNWAFSHVRTSYAVKWDGDMVLTTEGEGLLADFCWQVGRQRVNLRLPRHALYVESDRVAYLDLGLHNVEHYGHPILPSYSYVKAFEWEMLKFPPTSHNYTLPAGSCLELKHLDSDEFGHWTDPSAFATSPRTRRKRREYDIFQAIHAGNWRERDSLHRIEAPAGTHIVDHVVDTWLPQAPRPLVKDLGVRPSP